MKSTEPQTEMEPKCEDGEGVAAAAEAAAAGGRKGGGGRWAGQNGWKIPQESQSKMKLQQTAAMRLKATETEPNRNRNRIETAKEQRLNTSKKINK